MRQRSIQRDADSMTTSGYLVVSADGNLRLTATQPRLAADEVVMKLSVKVPKSLFVKPLMSARIEIPADAGVPPYIEASVVGDIREAVRQAIGMDLAITIVREEAGVA